MVAISSPRAAPAKGLAGKASNDPSRCGARQGFKDPGVEELPCGDRALLKFAVRLSSLQAGIRSKDRMEPRLGESKREPSDATEKISEMRRSGLLRSDSNAPVISVNMDELRVGLLVRCGGSSQGMQQM